MGGRAASVGTPGTIAHTCVLFLGESCKTTPATVIRVLAMRGGGL